MKRTKRRFTKIYILPAFILTLLFAIMYLNQDTSGTTENQQMFFDPHIPDGEHLVYTITNEDNPANNRTMTVHTNISGRSYNTVITTVYDSEARQGRNHEIHGVFLKSNMMPLDSRVDMNGGIHYRAQYNNDEVTVYINEGTIPGVDDFEPYEDVLELEDIYLDRELAAVQLRAFDFSLTDEYDAMLILGHPRWMSDISCKVSVVGTENVNGISCYKIMLNFGILGEVYSWYEVAEPHRMIKSVFDVFRFPFDGDVVILQQ